MHSPNPALHPQHSGTMNASSSQPRPPLRRAAYIHVSDLMNAYNIDHVRLEEELSRVKELQAKPNEERVGIPTELDTNQKRLQPPRGGFNACVLVGKVELVVDKKRVDGSRVRLAEVEVGDETGVVSLRARDEQIDLLRTVSERSGAVVLRNCTLELYQGRHIRLAITKWGKLNVYPDQVASTPPPPSKINRERQFSLIDLNIVASEMVENDPYQMDFEGHSAIMGRSQMYPGMAKTGARGRRTARPKPLGPGSVGAMPMHPHAGSAPIHYHNAGYGYGDLNQQYAYPARQPQDNIPSQQQQQFLYQYGMQQRPIYSERQPGPAVHMPAHPNPASNFDASSLVRSAHYMQPIVESVHQQSRCEDASSPGKMNPKAATFDPNEAKRPNP